MKKRKKLQLFEVVDIIVMILIGLIMLLPVLNVACKAVSSSSQVILGNVTFWPKEFQLNTIAYVIQSNQFIRSFLVTVRVTFMGTAGAMFLTLTAAYPLSKPALRGRKFFLYIFVFVMLFSAGMVPNYILFRSMKLTNTIWALVFSGMFSVFNLFLVKNFFETLPEEIEDAAKVDGAGNMKTFLSIVIPMSAPVIATVTLFYAVSYWGSYFAGVMYITDTDLKPLQQYMYELIKESLNVMDTSGNIADIDQAMNVSSENVQSATIVVSTIPILLVYPFLQKYFVKGMTIGSVKG